MVLKPFGRKAHEFAYRHPSQDKRINILYGAVRSSKTFAMIPKLMWLLKYQVAGAKLLTGVSKETVYNNVLNPLFDLLGAGSYSYNRQSGECIILGVKFRVIGAKDEGSERYIRGLTVGVAYCDELTLMPKSFFDMLIARMSPEAARLYATTNQDSPFHYVKADILDNPELAHWVWSQHFTLEDNPNLDEEYKTFIRRKYAAGVFYRRYILGEWAQAEGAIYGGLVGEALYDDATRPIGLLHRNGHMERWISVDAGTANAQVYGDFYDDGHTVWMDRCYYFDSRKEGFQKTNGQYADDLINGNGEDWLGIGTDSRDWPGIIVDPSAASFQAELRARGLVVVDGVNEVQEGIRRVSSMLARKKLRINRDHCKPAIAEMESYSWDEKPTNRKGIDQPLKQHDHAPDMIKYLVSTRINDWRIAA